MESPSAAGNRWSLITVLDGAGLAALLVLIATAEAFDGARADIQAVARYAEHPEAATPAWLSSVWLWVIVASAVIGAGVTFRAVFIARALQSPDEPRLLRGARQFTPLIAAAALVTWLWWQVVARAVVDGDYDRSSSDLVVRHTAAVGLAVIALALGGAVVGNATAATQRSGLVRVQLVFLAALYVLVFQAGFISDQLTDVLRGWGDGPGAQIVSRPLAGLAAAVLLGAVVRASAGRILLPVSAATAPEVPALSWPVVGVVLVVTAGLVVLHWFAALAIAASLVVMVSLVTEPGPQAAPPSPALTRGLRRLAGTLGVVPLAILLGGLVAASMNSLLLRSGPSHSDIRLLVWTGVVTAAFAALAAHSQVTEHVRFKFAATMPGALAGGVGLLCGLSSAASTTLAGTMLLVVAVVLALRLFGERGDVELWVAWAVGIGLAIAIYLRPIDVPRGLGGFAVALLGATAILALLHPLAGLASRYRVRGLRHKRRVPVLALAALWLSLAWWTAPGARNQVPTVPVAHAPKTVASAVGDWLDVVTRRPTQRSYVPMVLVAASGGGSKAGYWTDLVLDCMVGDPPAARDVDECPPSAAAPDRYGSLFLTSSVSGGSVGIYQLVHHDKLVGGSSAWIKDSMGREVLSPLLAWGLAHDLPAFLVGAPTRPARCGGWLSCRVNADRATVQAAAIAGTTDLGAVADARDALTASASTDSAFPVPIFNTTQVDRFDPVPVNPRRRVVLSRLTVAEPTQRMTCAEAADQPVPDAIDGYDLLGSGEDVTTLSAALLSARFPFLEPPGRLGSRTKRSDQECGGPPPQERAAKLRDGGTYENTGMMTLVDLLGPIEDGIGAWEREHHRVDVRIIVVSVDDDPPPIDPNPGLIRRALGSDASDRSDTARQRACADKRVAYVRISPQPHVGAQAATGWEVSETSRREDLMDSLRPDQGPGKRLQQLRDMLDATAPGHLCLD